MKEKKLLRAAEYVLPQRSVEGQRHYLIINGKKHDVFKMIEASHDALITRIDVAAFEPNLEEDCWRDSNGEHVSPAVVLGAIIESGGYNEALEKHKTLTEHIIDISKADTGYPILISSDNEILDGMHRIARATLDGLDQMPVRFVGEDSLSVSEVPLKEGN